MLSAFERLRKEIEAVLSAERMLRVLYKNIDTTEPDEIQVQNTLGNIIHNIRRGGVK